MTVYIFGFLSGDIVATCFLAFISRKNNKTETEKDFLDFIFEHMEKFPNDCEFRGVSQYETVLVVDKTYHISSEIRSDGTKWFYVNAGNPGGKDVFAPSITLLNKDSERVVEAIKKWEKGKILKNLNKKIEKGKSVEDLLKEAIDDTRRG